MPKGTADPAVLAHLKQLGLTVTAVGDPVDYAHAMSQACQYDLVVISSTIRSRDFLPGFRDIKVPLLTWENDILDDLRLTGRYKGHDFGEVEAEHYVWLVNAPHPLQGGLSAGEHAIYDHDQAFGWGRPGLGASIIATLPGQPDKAVLFGYERGATMDYDFIAPARRVFIPLGNTSFDKLDTEGLKLFDAAVDWAAHGSHASCGR
ncbi:hypothetical protein ACYJW8_02305 [Frateuria aurantia]